MTLGPVFTGDEIQLEVYVRIDMVNCLLYTNLRDIWGEVEDIDVLGCSFIIKLLGV